MSVLFLELARTVLLLSSSPQRMIFSMVVLDPHGGVAKNNSCGEACHTQAYFVCWCCGWGWTSCHNPWKQTHCHCVAKFCAGKEFAMTWKLCHRHYRGEPSLSLVHFPPTLIPSGNNMIFLTNLPSTPAGPVASRWAPLFMCSLKLILVLKMRYQMTKLIL